MARKISKGPELSEFVQEITNKYPLVLIEWDDHCSTMGWLPADDVMEKVTVCTIGLLCGETESSYIVSHSVNQGDHLADPISILKCAVITKVDLTEL